jgi:hypothetical protein
MPDANRSGVTTLCFLSTTILLLALAGEAIS